METFLGILIPFLGTTLGASCVFFIPAPPYLLSFAAGAMLYVVFGEIIPQAVLMYRSKVPAFFVIIGMLIGMIIIYV